jgi:hypothetical protein
MGTVDAYRALARICDHTGDFVKMQGWLFTLCLFPFLCFSQEITLEHLSKSIGEEVQVRGFLYCDADHRFILASTPNLKTCCLLSPQNQKNQLLVHGDFSSIDSTKVVLLKGILQTEPQGLYLLTNAELVPQTSLSLHPLWLGLFPLLGLAYWKKRRS